MMGRIEANEHVIEYEHFPELSSAIFIFVYFSLHRDILSSEIQISEKKRGNISIRVNLRGSFSLDK